MMNAYNTPDVLHVIAQDGEGNKRMIRYIRESHVKDFAMFTQRKLDDLIELCDKNEPCRGEQDGKIE